MTHKRLWMMLSILAGVALLVTVTAATASALSQGAQPQGASAAQGALGTAFTYQGRLDRNGEPVDGDCQMAFRLYDEASGGSQVGSAISQTVPISDGLFTVALDFGSGVFGGEACWLSIQVLCPGDSVAADLGRQELTASPYALYAASATYATTATFATNADLLDGQHASAFALVTSLPEGCWASTSDDISIGDSWTTVAQCDISLPSDAYIFVEASAASHSSGVCLGEIAIGFDGNRDTISERWLSFSAIESMPFTSSTMTSLNAGTHTVSFWARRVSGTASFHLINRTLSAVSVAP